MLWKTILSKIVIKKKEQKIYTHTHQKKKKNNNNKIKSRANINFVDIKQAEYMCRRRLEQAGKGFPQGKQMASSATISAGNSPIVLAGY